MTAPEYLPTAEVARALGVEVSTVHRMVTRGDLTPAFKAPGLRGAYLFSPADVAALTGAAVGLSHAQETPAP